MEIRIPTQIIVYLLGLVAVIVITGAIMGIGMYVDRRITRRKLEQALREDTDKH